MRPGGNAAFTAGALELLARHIPRRSITYEILVAHGEAVARKALTAAAAVRHLAPDLRLIGEGALLHDIGIHLTDTPELGCRGEHPYICHGVLGRELLEKAGWPRHALICERHVGAGISEEEIRRLGLPLPLRDMRPQTLEEQIVCFADKFFSKNGNGNGREKPLSRVLDGLARHGEEKRATFLRWARRFGEV
jgi:uncharacterized protein